MPLRCNPKWRVKAGVVTKARFFGARQPWPMSQHRRKNLKWTQSASPHPWFLCDFSKMHSATSVSHVGHGPTRSAHYSSTQLCGFCNQRIVSVKSLSFSKTKSGFALFVIDSSLGPLVRRHRQCPCILVVPEVTHEDMSRALEGRLISSKSPSRVQDGDEGVVGSNRIEKHFPDEGL